MECSRKGHYLTLVRKFFTKMPKTKKQKFDQFLLRELKKEKRKELFRNYKKFEHSSQLTSFPSLTSTPHYQKLKCDRDAVDEQVGQHRNHAFNRPSIDSSKHDNDELSSSDKDNLNQIDSNIYKESSDSSIDEKCLEPNLKEGELRSAQNSLSLSTKKRKKRKRKSNIKLESSCIPQTTAKFIPLSQNMEKSFFVVPTRTESIQQERILLPVVGEEQLIMETIYNNDVTILCAQTGSGKTTQVPQFLFEAGFGDCNHPLYKGIVGITQPRRVAAVSVAKRVQQELGENSDGVVAYQIRYDSSTVGKSTCIKFMTDGILLRELSIGDDMLLTKYSCIIIDEAHERTVGTDILIGWLSRIVKLRNSGRISGVGPLKLIIMSATLRVEDFTDSRLFDSPPVIEIPGRQHKVIVHYNRVTEDNYLEEVVKKVKKIHSTMTLGAILVFVTGQNEVKYLCKKLKDLYGTNAKPEIEDSDLRVDCDGIFNEPEEDYESEVDEFDTLENLEEASDAEEDEVHLLAGNVEDEEEIPEIMPKKNLKLHVLPLYSMLSTAEQLKVFQPTEEDTRLVVVATNVAETSLTIPGVKYVVDTGKEKQRAYDTQTNIQKFQIQWTSAASADQRAGRAGRTGPGHCYRLYSSAVFSNYFPKFSTPEIDRIPLQGVVLNLKSLGIKNVIGFPFPTAPDQYQLKDAEKVLSAIGALKDGVVTPLGEKINLFPVSPRLGKMLVVSSAQSDICPMTIAAVAGMSVGQIFIHEIEIENPGAEEIIDNNAGERTQFYKKMMVNLTELGFCRRKSYI